MPVILLVLTLCAGFFLVYFLERVGMMYLRTHTENVIKVVVAGIRHDLRSCQNAARAMAGSPWIPPSLLDPSPENLKNANSVLDRYNASLGFSICYLLDREGNTIASSNRNAADSFFGQNYAFRPYFQEAVLGNASVYMAVGITSKERGFYAAHPVKDGLGKVVGAAVIKESIDLPVDVLSGYADSFFVSPEGVIFMSGHKELVLRPLWPLSTEKAAAIRQSRQFPISSLEPVLKASVRDGERILFRGRFYQVFQRPLGPQGWSLVLFAPLQNVFYFVLLGWIITIFASVIVLILTIWASLHVRAQEALQASEEKYRGLFEYSRDAIMVIRSPSWEFVSANLATLEMFRAKNESEFTSSRPWELSPERQPDGRVSAEKAKEIIEMAVRDGFCSFEWTHKRLDGEEFPAMVLLTRMMLGKDMIIQATVRDVTQEKRIDEELKKKAEELARFNKIAVGRELKMIELKKKLETHEKKAA